MYIKYSEAEQNLIKAISEHWYHVIHSTDMIPVTLYRILAVECFINNKQGPAIEALRKVCKAIEDCKIFRHTKEFDDLCKF